MKICPDMEGVRDEMVANNNIQFNEAEDSLLYKLNGQLLIESQNVSDPLNDNCPGGSLRQNVDTIECKDLSNCVVSGRPFNSHYSTDDPGTRVSVEELTVGNYRNRALVLGSDTGSSKVGSFEHLQLLAMGSGSQPQDMDQMLLKIRQQLARAPSERQNLETFMSKRSDHSLDAVSARLRAAGDKDISNAPALTGGNGMPQLRTSFTSSSFSQLILKRALKGKAIVGRNQDAHSELGNDQDIGCKEERVNGKPPGTLDALIPKSSSKKYIVNSHKADRSCPKSSVHGISLREYLKPGYSTRDKVQGLLLFRQLVELVDLAHSQGIALQDVSPSFFTLSPSGKLRYIGSFSKKELDSDVNEDTNKKRPLVQESSMIARDLKQRKLDVGMHSTGSTVQFVSNWTAGKKTSSVIDLNRTDAQNTDCCELPYKNNFKHPATYLMARKQSLSTAPKLQEQWYTSPEDLNGDGCIFKSNIYALGVLLFELLCDCESDEMHTAVMSDLRHRILPPKFLSKNPKEAGFCLLLMHPEPSSRPTAREMLQSELIHEDNSAISPTADEEESGLLLHFLASLEEQKQKHASKLIQDIQTLEDDIKEAERRYSSDTSLTSSLGDNERRGQSCTEGPSSTSLSSAHFVPNMNTDRLMKNIGQLEDAYFFMRSRMKLSDSVATACSDKILLKDRDRRSGIQNENKDSRTKGKASDQLEVFFEGLCKFARYSKFETCGTIRSGDLLNSANVICSLSFDPDEEHIAAAGISKRIKIFDFGAFMNESVTVHYPLVEMCNKSKLSCICWNSYIKNCLASTDYDGVVQIWDAGTGQGFSQHVEHQRRAWSVDFSPSDPTKFVSGSDDCSVKLWSINEKRSVGTIRSPANVCCVQFSSSSNHLLTFGSADYKVYCYDLRHVRTPWCTLAGHEKAVSYVKFLDSDTIVSASTDNSLKLWNLNKTSSSGLSSGACTLTFKGHTNQKNFVGLSALDGYIACGSETNEVYSYYQSFPMPITSYKFGSFDPISGNEVEDDHGQFVSSVCWRRKSSMLVAANSTGSMKLLKLV